MDNAASPRYRFSPSEQPIFDGGPYAPAHHPARRAAYLAAGVFVGLCAQLGHSLTLVNLPLVGAGLGLAPPEAGWLLAAYVSANCSANLLLVRGRVRYGIPKVTYGLLLAYVLLALLQLAAPSFTAALGVRIISGFVASALTTVTIYYLLQVVPPQKRPLALIVGVSLTQLAVPLARLVPVALLTPGEWQGVYLMELAMALTVTAVLLAVPLPPSILDKGVEALDLLTFALSFFGLMLLCGALAAGRWQWWTDTPWIGAALAGSVPLLAAAYLLEHHRRRPLLLSRWIGRREILRYLSIALLLRFALAEQSFGAIGLFSAMGLNNDQLRGLFLIVLAAMAAGLLTAVLTWTPERTFHQIVAAALTIAAGAWLDSGANALTRPPQLYLSQALLGFGACLFVGPALIFGFGQVLQRGRDHFISMVVMFGISQNLGGLLGASLLGTWQAVRAKAHAAALSEHLLPGDPGVAARWLQQGSAGLNGALQAQANVMAFNDVFRLVSLLALAIAIYLAWPAVAGALRALNDKRRRAQP